MTDHEQPAAGVAIKPVDQGLVDRIAGQNWLGIESTMFRLTQSQAESLSEALKAPTDAGGAVSEVADLRQALDLALIRLGRMEPGDSRAVSDEYVAMAAAGTPHHNDEGRAIIGRAILIEGEAALSSPQPLQQGGEVTRAMIEAILAKHLANNPSQIAFGNATGAILALFASLAADRDKAVGIANRQADNMAFVINHVSLNHWHDKFLRELEEDRDALSRLSRQKDQPHD